MKMVYRAPGNEGKNNQFNWAGPYNFGQEFKEGDDWATKKTKAEKQVLKLTSDFHWTDDESIELTQYIPGMGLFILWATALFVALLKVS